MPSREQVREKLLRQAGTVLPPELAILLECAYEGESLPAPAEYMRGLIARFNECALGSIPLHDDVEQVYEREVSGDNGAWLTVGLLTRGTLLRETVFACGAQPGERELEARIVEATLSGDIAAAAPIVLGVGLSDNPERARELARAALFRPVDAHAAETLTARAERRTLVAINSTGPGAGGLGGGHTALGVAIERDGTGYVALSPGDYFTSYARARILHI
jgi:hypothetical protein